MGKAKIMGGGSSLKVINGILSESVAYDEDVAANTFVEYKTGVTGGSKVFGGDLSDPIAASGVRLIDDVNNCRYAIRQTGSSNELLVTKFVVRDNAVIIAQQLNLNTITYGGDYFAKLVDGGKMICIISSPPGDNKAIQITLVDVSDASMSKIKDTVYPINQLIPNHSKKNSAKFESASFDLLNMSRTLVLFCNLHYSALIGDALHKAYVRCLVGINIESDIVSIPSELTSGAVGYRIYDICERNEGTLLAVGSNIASDIGPIDYCAALIKYNSTNGTLDITALPRRLDIGMINTNTKIKMYPDCDLVFVRNDDHTIEVTSLQKLNDAEEVRAYGKENLGEAGSYTYKDGTVIVHYKKTASDSDTGVIYLYKIEDNNPYWEKKFTSYPATTDVLVMGYSMCTVDKKSNIHIMYLYDSSTSNWAFWNIGRFAQGLVPAETNILGITTSKATVDKKGKYYTLGDNAGISLTAEDLVRIVAYEKDNTIEEIKQEVTKNVNR